jgi:hypothetical protein
MLKIPCVIKEEQENMHTFTTHVTLQKPGKQINKEMKSIGETEGEKYY